MLAESAPWTFYQNNTVMLTYSYYDIVLALEMQNKILSLSSTIMLIWHQWLLWNSKLFFYFVMLVYLYDVINCDVINVKNFREIWGASFKFWLCLWCVTSSRGKFHKKNVWNPNLCQRGQNRPETRLFAIFSGLVH